MPTFRVENTAILYPVSLSLFTTRLMSYAKSQPTLWIISVRRQWRRRKVLFDHHLNPTELKIRCSEHQWLDKNITKLVQKDDKFWNDALSCEKVLSPNLKKLGHTNSKYFRERERVRERERERRGEERKKEGGGEERERERVYFTLLSIMCIQV